jgi:hypothetical protein
MGAETVTERYAATLIVDLKRLDRFCLVISGQSSGSLFHGK